MKFKSEVDLVEATKALIKDIYNKNYIAIFTEVSLGYGIADIVISELKNSRPEELQSERILNVLDINIYSLVQKYESIEVNDILDITRCSRQNVSKSLSKLVLCNYILSDGNEYKSNKIYELPFRNNFAIEAKLKDWKRALNQAYRYKWFAEYSYVVLDGHYSKAAIKNIDYFIRYNVGLVSVSTDGSFRRHFTPSRQKPFDLKMQILFSEKVKNQTLAR